MVEHAVVPKRPADLLNRILESPGLVKMVQDQPPSVLTRLVQHIGLEDAAEIVAMATGEQLNRVFDEDLWYGPQPGEEESFDAKRFILWLEVLFETNIEAAMEKIAGFDEDLITLALSQQILVLDMDALAMSMTGYERDDEVYLIEKVIESTLSLEFDRYLVIAKPHCRWDAISTLLVELNQADEAMLDRLLQYWVQLSTENIEGNGGLYDVLTSGEMLADDLTGERQERRRQDGYVPPTSAAAFLEQARSRTLAQHVAAKQWDYDTSRYFKSLHTDAAGTGASDPGPVDSVDRQRFRKLLQEAEIFVPHNVRKQLASDGPPPEHMTLVRAMQALRAVGEEAYSRRMGEVTYLSNVLMTGCPIRGRRFRPVEAAETALATCQLGAEHLTGRSLTDAEDRDLAHLTQLLVDTDMVRLFNCGWRILHERVSMPAARSLAELMRQAKDTIHDTLRRRDLQGTLLSLDKKIKAARPWLFVPEMDDLLGELDNDVLMQLSDLLGEYPVLPAILQRPEDNAMIHTCGQVAIIERYLTELKHVG